MQKIKKRTWYAMFILSMFLLCSSALSAQQRAISGVVTEPDGEPAIGATVQVKGTTVGTMTDVSGRFSLNVPANGKTLVVSYVGFTTQEIPIEGDTFNIVMDDSGMDLDEVVVIGYASVPRRDLTSAISSIGSKALEVPMTNTVQAMQGKLAGVQIVTSDGSPDAEMIIRVRGGGSITQDNSPLYIVDGFPVSSINDIPPTDIESIDILKDASSAAIYGARGANGVVIITTKGAKAGKTTVSVNAYLKGKKMAKTLDVMNPYEFVYSHYEYAALRGMESSDMSKFKKYFGNYQDMDLYKYMEPTDWQDELFGGWLLTQNYNVSINGGTEKTKFNFSGNFVDDEGLLVGNGYQRTNLSLKLNHEIASNLIFDFNTRISDVTKDGAGTSGSSQLRTTDGITRRPVDGLFDQLEIDDMASEEEYDSFLRSTKDPVELAKQDWRKRVDQTFVLNGALTWNILKGLTLRSEFGYSYGFGENKRYYGADTKEAEDKGKSMPLGELTNSRKSQWRENVTLNYVFNPAPKQSLNLLVGQEVISESSSENFMRALYFSDELSPEKLFANMALGSVDRITSSVSPDTRLVSFFGRAMYNINERYLFNVTLRADGSSKFAPGNQWGFFPAGSAAWRISEEEFMQSLDVLSNLKLRFSYGQAGNNRISNVLWKNSYKISNDRTYGIGNVDNPYYVPNSKKLSNPDLKWETTITRDLGLDFGFLNERFQGTVDFYWNTTKDLLIDSDIPSYLGYTTQTQNIGQTSNRGIELTLNADIVKTKDFYLSAGFNISFNRAKIDHLASGDEMVVNSGWAGTDLRAEDDYRVRVGETVGLIYGFVTDGYYTADDFQYYDEATGKYVLKEGVASNSLATGVTGVRPGSLKLKDLDGDGDITSENDRQVIGNANPKHTGGFNITMGYKGFDLTAYFNWSYGNDIYNANKLATSMNYRTTYGNMLDMMNSSNRWTYLDNQGQVVTDLAELATLNRGKTMWSHHSLSTTTPVIHSWAIEDGSFLRLNTLTIGYTLPRHITMKTAISQLRFYTTFENVFVWTNYSGYDPEVSTPVRNSSYQALTPGVDYSAYPKSRGFTVGMNLTF